MAKLDKSQYTKQQWKIIQANRRLEKEQRRLEKNLTKQENQVREQTTEKTVESPKETKRTINYALNNDRSALTNYIVCLKHGTKYGPEYVNNLFRMVQRNCTIPHEFICFTENAAGIIPEVTVEPLPSNEMKHSHGWWYKPMFFSNALPMPSGTLLFFDLDVVIFENIDKFFEHEPGKFCIIRDFNRSIRHDWNKFNSSVFRLEIGRHSHVYTKFMENSANHIRRLHGDQDWIYEQMKDKDYTFWPDEWIQSYKWEMRDRKDLVKTANGRLFKNIAEPRVKLKTSVAVFHGEPAPHQVDDPWVKKHWQ